MITGDQALTACHVAGQVHIISKPTLILGPARNSEGYEWISPDETEIIHYRYICTCHSFAIFNILVNSILISCFVPISLVFVIFLNLFGKGLISSSADLLVIVVQ